MPAAPPASTSAFAGLRDVKMPLKTPPRCPPRHGRRLSRPGRPQSLQRRLVCLLWSGVQSRARVAGGLGTDSGNRGCGVQGLVVGSSRVRLLPTPLVGLVRWSERPRGLGESRGGGGMSRRPAWALGELAGRAGRSRPRLVLLTLGTRGWVCPLSSPRRD